MGIARGFQSLPIAYGDTTVRKPEKVTGMLKGIEVGSKELAYGFYDGITGVVTQPIRGAKDKGAVGLFRGLIHGLGGFILKPGAGIFGLPAYALQGVSQEIHNLLFEDREKLVVWSRLVQGREEVMDVGEEEKVKIIRVWESVCKV
jgi:hypothetical protein